MKKKNLISIIFAVTAVIVLSILPYGCDKNEGSLPPPVVTGCDTAHVSFATVVQPLFQPACTGCHGATGGIAGVNLLGYDNVKIHVNAAVSAIQEGGSMRQYLTMPADTINCRINKVKAWVKNNMPNN